MRSERGNIVVYIIVGLALFGALLTGVWWVKSHAPKTVAAPHVATSKDEAKMTETTIKQDETSKPNESSAATDQATPAPSTSNTTPAPTIPGDYPSQSSSTSTTTPSATPPKPESQTPHATSGPVAASGPVEDSIMNALALGGAVYIVAAYLRSRRLARVHIFSTR